MLIANLWKPKIYFVAFHQELLMSNSRAFITQNSVFSIIVFLLYHTVSIRGKISNVKTDIQCDMSSYSSAEIKWAWKVIRRNSGKRFSMILSSVLPCSQRELFSGLCHECIQFSGLCHECIPWIFKIVYRRGKLINRFFSFFEKSKKCECNDRKNRD